MLPCTFSVSLMLWGFVHQDQFDLYLHSYGLGSLDKFDI